MRKNYLKPVFNMIIIDLDNVIKTSLTKEQEDGKGVNMNDVFI